MTVNELKNKLEQLSENGYGDLPLAFFANNHYSISDEPNGRSTINICSVNRIYSNNIQEKKFVLIGNYQGSVAQFKTISHNI